MSRAAPQLTLFGPARVEPNAAVGHTCHARDCDKPVVPEKLMCLRHWRLVPKTIQRAVWAAYRPGQCDDKRPSREWLLAADAAIGFVAQLERRGLSRSERAALAVFGYPQ